MQFSWLHRLFLCAVLFCVAQPAFAHFKLNLNIRILHVEHQGEGLQVYLRLPMAYLVANLVGEVQSDGIPSPAPYTSNAMVDGELMHYVDFAAVSEDPIGLGQLAADGHQLSIQGHPLSAEVLSTQIHTGLSQPPFSNLEEAKAAFKSMSTAATEPPPFVGDVVVDVRILYRHDKTTNRYSLASSLVPNLPGQQETANLIVDYAGQEPLIFRLTGLLAEPVEISHSAWASLLTFVVEGVKHILAGYDHVLFVVCLVLGAATLTTLAWRVTGFTLGHTITLSIGFFGYVPTADWFIPLVESGIAISIIAAAALALGSIHNRETASGGLLITIMVGLLHGLGFSFVLQEILGVNTPNVWGSLLAFNVGVELGQLAIVLLLWPLLFLLSRRFPQFLPMVIWTIALPCIAVASYWTGERLIGLLNSM